MRQLQPEHGGGGEQHCRDEGGGDTAACTGMYGYIQHHVRGGTVMRMMD